MQIEDQQAFLKQFIIIQMRLLSFSAVTKISQAYVLVACDFIADHCLRWQITVFYHYKFEIYTTMVMQQPPRLLNSIVNASFGWLKLILMRMSYKVVSFHHQRISTIEKHYWWDHYEWRCRVYIISLWKTSFTGDERDFPSVIRYRISKWYTRSNKCWCSDKKK